MNYNDYEIEELQDALEVLSEAVENENRISNAVIHSLLQREDCFVLTKKRMWQDRSEFNEDWKKVTDRKMKVSAFVYPSKAVSDDDWIQDVLDDLNYGSDVFVVEGDSIVLIGTY